MMSLRFGGLNFVVKIAKRCGMHAVARLTDQVLDHHLEVRRASPTCTPTQILENAYSPDTMNRPRRPLEWLATHACGRLCRRSKKAGPTWSCSILWGLRQWKFFSMQCWLKPTSQGPLLSKTVDQRCTRLKSANKGCGSHSDIFAVHGEEDSRQPRVSICFYTCYNCLRRNREQIRLKREPRGMHKSIQCTCCELLVMRQRDTAIATAISSPIQVQSARWHSGRVLWNASRWLSQSRKAGSQTRSHATCRTKWVWTPTRMHDHIYSPTDGFSFSFSPM